METKMWSYKLVWDTLFAPNPLFNILTLATCKPTIRSSRNTVTGMWIAGFSACITHNPPMFGGGIDKCNKGDEKLIYLAQISNILPLDEYWKQYPQKRCTDLIDHNVAQWYGDNIYSRDHTDNEGNVVAWPNNGEHEGAEVGKRDYLRGKNALICKRFYYFTPNKRMEVPSKFKHLVHEGRGQSIKSDGVYEFINYVAEYANNEGVINGIVGKIPVIYTKTSFTDENEFQKGFRECATNNKKRGCAK